MKQILKKITAPKVEILNDNYIMSLVNKEPSKRRREIDKLRLDLNRSQKYASKKLSYLKDKRLLEKLFYLTLDKDKICFDFDEYLRD